MIFQEVRKNQIWQQNGGSYKILVQNVTFPPPAGLTTKVQTAKIIGIDDKQEYSVSTKWIMENYHLFAE